MKNKKQKSPSCNYNKFLKEYLIYVLKVTDRRKLRKN